MDAAPRTPFQTSFDHLNEIYYTTDDGFAELRPRMEPRHDAEHVAGLYEIFARYEEVHRRVTVTLDPRSLMRQCRDFLSPSRKEMETLWICRERSRAMKTANGIGWIDSRTRDAFLGRLANADYEAGTSQEEFIRRCIAAVQNGTLAEEEGRTARSFLSSWRYALDHFDLTRGLLADVPVHTRAEAMHAQSFKDFVADQQDLWIYCSNVFEFVFFDLTFRFPRNAALFASYFDKTEMLDLGTAGSTPVTVHCRIPMSIEC